MKQVLICMHSLLSTLYREVDPKEEISIFGGKMKLLPGHVDIHNRELERNKYSMHTIKL